MRGGGIGGMMAGMKMLLTNDDGIRAEGIRVLAEAVKGIGEVSVVAPDGERSAIAQAITLDRPLYAEPWPEEGKAFGWAVSGTPADCVKIGVRKLLPEPPDLVLSGINLGPNAGISVLYSGTVSAASEALILGLPAIAFSLTTFEGPIWDTAARVARRVVEQVASGEVRLTPDTIWNVNIPNVPWEELKGIQMARMGESRFVETYTEMRDAEGRKCYSMKGDLVELGDPEGTDLQALREGYVALTPVRLDRTHHAAMAALRGKMPVL